MLCCTILVVSLDFARLLGSRCPVFVFVHDHLCLWDWYIEQCSLLLPSGAIFQSIGSVHFSESAFSIQLNNFILRWCYIVKLYFTLVLYSSGKWLRSATPVGISFSKVSSRKNWTMCEICSKLKVKTREWRHGGVLLLSKFH